MVQDRAILAMAKWQMNSKSHYDLSTRRALGGAPVPPTKVFRRLTASVNEIIVKPCVAAVVGRKTILKPRLAAATNTYK